MRLAFNRRHLSVGTDSFYKKQNHSDVEVYVA
jgi:hypothetical protein